jgi:pSer/pThr/pTyr-binding forkhead associated (FHA) protein
MKLVIEDHQGRREAVPFVGEVLTIGRLADNQVRLEEKDVSRRHGRITRTAARTFVVEDLSSLTGIRVNGQRITEPREIGEGDLIHISAFELSLEAGPEDRAPEPAPPQAPPPAPSTPPAATAPPPRAAPGPAPAPPAEGAQPRELRAAEKPRLVGLSGPLRGKAWLVARTPASLGRAAGSDVAIDHPSLGDVQCTLGQVNGAWRVLDASGQNALRVNGALVSEASLVGGETLQLGEVKLIFLAAGQPFTLPPEEGEAEGQLPQRMAPIKIVSASTAARRKRLRFVAKVAAAALAAAALAAAAARLISRREASMREAGSPARGSEAPAEPRRSR